MNGDILSHMVKWTENKSQLLLLQEVYGVFGILSFVLAGIVGLFNQTLGFGMLIIPIVIFSALGLNIVAWALIRLAIESIASRATKKIAAQAEIEALRAREAKRVSRAGRKTTRKSTKSK